MTKRIMFEVLVSFGVRKTEGGDRFQFLLFDCFSGFQVSDVSKLKAEGGCEDEGKFGISTFSLKPFSILQTYILSEEYLAAGSIPGAMSSKNRKQR